MAEAEVLIMTDAGMHARPAAMFVKLASRYPCDIFVEKEGDQVNGKSIMGLLMLALTSGSKIKIIAKGEQEQEALDALIELVSGGFGES